MPIYVNKNDQQLGPYEEHVVMDQLRSGQLSPTDLGIRQGDSAWQSLGDLFPGVAYEQATSPAGADRVGGTARSSTGTAAVASTPKKGGCLKGALIGAGLLFLLLGIAVAAGSRYIPSTACDLAESDARKIDKLRSDLDKATTNGDFDKIGPLQIELTEELAGAATTQRYCNDDKFRDNAIGISGGVLGFVGLLMAVIGLFVGRRK